MNAICTGRGRGLFSRLTVVILCIIVTVANAAASGPRVEFNRLQLPNNTFRQLQQQQQEHPQQRRGQQRKDSSLDSPFLKDFAHGCTPPKLQRWPEGPLRVPALPAGQKPNFIVILVDDQGFDDIGLHHPRGPDGISSAGAQTPNLDKLIKGGLSFTNFYVNAMCAVSRSALLTGRDAVRTGTLFNGYGYDSFSLKEATMGDVMQQAGYVTSHYGKWHNGRVDGYEPWNRGFNESWLPDDFVHVDNLMRYNGEYRPTKGLMEQVLVNNMVSFMQEREADKKPFLAYYAPYSIHRMPPKRGADSEVGTAYFSPKPYLEKIMAQQHTADPWNAQLWAMLMYIDDVLGVLFNYVEASPLLRTNTYIMVSGDNGPALPASVKKNSVTRLRRMPSGMLGDKNTFIQDRDILSSGVEGSLRNHLSVWGPGVPAGGVRHELTSVTDILATIAELAGATGTQHRPWSGASFANLLLPAAVPTFAQQNRFLFTFVASGDDEQCPQLDRLMSERLPDLNSDREVQRPQPLLAYTDTSGNRVFENCIVGRHKDFKWFGSTGKLFRVSGDSHIELPCNKVTGDEAPQVSRLFDQAARQWWTSVLAEPDSFTKPVYNIGQAGALASNVEAAGAMAIKRGVVTVTSNAVFTGEGYACLRVDVATRGMYNVTAMYRCDIRGPSRPDFITAVGPWRDIIADTSPRLLNSVARQVGAAGDLLGSMFLEASNGARTEVCVKLLGVRTPDPAKPGVAKPRQQQQAGSSDHNRSSSSSSSSSIQGSLEAGGMSSLGNMPATATQYRNVWRARGNAWSARPRGYVAVPGTWQFRLVNLRFELQPGMADPPPGGCCKERLEGRAAASIVEEAGPAASAGVEAAHAAAASGAGASVTQPVEMQQQPSSGDGDSVPSGIPAEVVEAVLAGTAAEPAQYSHIKPTPAMVELEQDMRAAAGRADSQAAAAAAAAAQAGSQDSSSGGGSSTVGAGSGTGPNSSPYQLAWLILKEKYQYAGGQGVFESMYRPCYADTKGACAESCG